MAELVVTLAAGVAGHFAHSAVALIRARRAKARARVARLHELAALLQESGNAFQSQASMASRLMEILARHHPGEMPKDAVGYNQTFARLYPSFTDAERDLFFVIRGLTRGAVKDANDRMSEWLRKNGDVLSLEDPLVGADLADRLLTSASISANGTRSSSPPRTKRSDRWSSLPTSSRPALASRQESRTLSRKHSSGRVRSALRNTERTLSLSRAGAPLFPWRAPLTRFIQPVRRKELWYWAWSNVSPAAPVRCPRRGRPAECLCRACARSV
jgi:hypothetical protein